MARLRYCALFVYLQTFAGFCGPPKPDSIAMEQQEKIPTIAEVQAELKSADAATRGMAAATVVRENMRELVPALLSMLKNDPAHNARTAAAIALAAFNEKRAAPFIAQMLASNQGARDLLVEALGELKTPEYASVVVPLLRENDFATRYKAAEALKKMQAVQMAPAVLQQAQQINDAEILQTHIMALGWLKYRPAENFILATGKKNPASPLCATALLALGELKSVGALSFLLENFRGSDLKLRENAATALRQIAHSDSARALFAELKNPQDDVVLLAVDILADYPAELVVRDARKILSANDKSLSAAAAFLLGHKKDLASREKMEQVLRDTETKNREMAARAFGYLQSRESVPLLRQVAAEKEGRARYGAIWSLGVMAATEALPELRAALRSSDRELVAYALEALAAMPAEEDIPLLKQHLYDDRGQPILAASALARIKGEKALQVLLAATTAQSHAVRAAAYEGLGLRRDQAAIPFLAERLEKGTAEEKKMAIAVLRNTTGEKWSTPAQWLRWFKGRGAVFP